MTEPVKRGMLKIGKIFGWGTLVAGLVGVGAIGQIFHNNTEVCKEDVPDMQTAIVTISSDMAYVKKGQERTEIKLDDLTKSVHDVLFIYELNQSLSRPSQEPKIETAQMMQSSEWKNL